MMRGRAVEVSGRQVWTAAGERAELPSLASSWEGVVEV